MHGLHVYVHVLHGKKGGMLHARNKEGSREEFGRIIGWIWFPNLASCTDQNSKELMCVTWLRIRKQNLNQFPDSHEF